MTGLRVVFAGTPAFGLQALEALHQAHTVIAVYTQPDRPSGRGRKLTYSPIKQWAVDKHMPIHQPLHFKTEEVVDTLARLAPDILVVAAYGLILPKSVLAIPKLGCLNIHASLLPRWRGASPIQHAILHGDKTSGVSFMQMAAGMDTGDIWGSVECPILQTDTASSLHDKLAEIAAPGLLAVLPLIQQQGASAVPQEASLVTYAPKLTKEGALLNWQLPAITLARQVRAFNPWPVACFKWQAHVINVYEATAVSFDTTALPGTVLSVTPQGIKVAAQEGALMITKLQWPSSKPMLVRDFLNGKKGLDMAGVVLQ